MQAAHAKLVANSARAIHKRALNVLAFIIFCFCCINCDQISDIDFSKSSPSLKQKYLRWLSASKYLPLSKRYTAGKYWLLTLLIMLTKGGCPKTMLSIKDALEALEGKWKLLILFSLASGPRRFKQIAVEVDGISDKVLSKELKSLEANELIKREVYNTFPPTAEYMITEHGKSLEGVMEALHYWGLAHRKKIMGR